MQPMSSLDPLSALPKAPACPLAMSLSRFPKTVMPSLRPSARLKMQPVRRCLVTLLPGLIQMLRPVPKMSLDGRKPQKMMGTPLVTVTTLRVPLALIGSTRTVLQRPPMIPPSRPTRPLSPRLEPQMLIAVFPLDVVPPTDEARSSTNLELPARAKIVTCPLPLDRSLPATTL